MDGTYNKKLINQVREISAKDIELFGYDFDEHEK